MSKDKHALIKANIVLNKKVQELERDVRYLRERENKIIEINQHRMKYLAEIESRNMLLELDNKRYREYLELIRITGTHGKDIKTGEIIRSDEANLAEEALEGED